MNQEQQSVWDTLMKGDRDRIGYIEFTAALDAYAHGLAEQIREAADAELPDTSGGMRAGADLIDPEVQR